MMEFINKINGMTTKDMLAFEFLRCLIKSRAGYELNIDNAIKIAFTLAEKFVTKVEEN